MLDVNVHKKNMYCMYVAHVMLLPAVHYQNAFIKIKFLGSSVEFWACYEGNNEMCYEQKSFNFSLS